jgi:exopolyphosphatase/guanosine-5'-triphosphate,3'-diphosphate pyrophosphatase
VKDGLLLDLLETLQDESKRTHRDQVLDSALQLGQKYSFDEGHGTTVAEFATKLFDDTASLHDLDDEARLLLEVAALLHNLGTFININGHHKHSYYLLSNSPLIGLSDEQRAIVANVARYHRKSPPTLDHEPYRALSPKERVLVSKLAALLRVADSFDREHGGKVSSFQVEQKGSQFLIQLKGKGDLLLERWAITQKSDLFEEVFGLKVSVAD